MASPISVSLTLDAARSDALDAIARATDRELDAVIAEAVDAYLDVQRWQVEHIAEGLRQAEAGEFASDEEVAATFARWCQKSGIPNSRWPTSPKPPTIWRVTIQRRQSRSSAA